jgi:hypothetical protein
MELKKLAAKCQMKVTELYLQTTLYTPNQLQVNSDLKVNTKVSNL